MLPCDGVGMHANLASKNIELPDEYLDGKVCYLKMGGGWGRVE
jgi:hypothetical protein